MTHFQNLWFHVAGKGIFFLITIVIGLDMALPSWATWILDEALIWILSGWLMFMYDKLRKIKKL